MNPDSSVGRILTVAEAEIYFERVIAAEKVMGPLSIEEKTVLLRDLGKDTTMEDLTELLANKRVLDTRGMV